MIKGVEALPPLTSGTMAKDIGPLAKQRGARLKADAERFARAGWVFVPQQQTAKPGLKVYKMAGGRLALAGRALNLKFKPDTSDTDIETVLRKHHLRKRRQLGLGKKLMTVEIERGDEVDPFAYSAALAKEPGVDFAEAVTVDHIGQR